MINSSLFSGNTYNFNLKWGADLISLTQENRKVALKYDKAPYLLKTSDWAT